MRRPALLASAFLAMGSLLGPSSASAQMTLKDYAAIQAGQSAVRDDFAMVYLAGVLEGLQTANALASAAGNPLFCVPVRQRDPEVGDLKPLIDAAVAQARAEQRDFDRYARLVTVGLVGVNTLSKLYPCAAAELPAPAAGPSSPVVKAP